MKVVMALRVTSDPIEMHEEWRRLSAGKPSQIHSEMHGFGGRGIYNTV